jgi:hypothetical protein
MAGPSPQLRWTQEDVNEFSRVLAEESAKFTKAMIEKAQSPLLYRLAAAEAEIAVLKAGMLTHGGDWDPRKTYVKNQLVRRGGLWRCVVDSTTAVPGDSDDFQLLLRRDR